MLTHIDHVILATDDFVAASVAWGDRLGFALQSPGGHPAYGTRNRAIRFPLGYVELITIVDAERAAQSELGQSLASAIAGGERWFGFALASSDIEADVATLRSGGSSATEITRGEWEGTDGRLYSWRYCFLVNTGGLPLPFIIQYDNLGPEAFVSEAAYGVQSVQEVVLAVADVNAAVVTFQRELGLRASVAGNVAVVGLPQGRIILTPAITDAPGVSLVGLGVADLATAERQLHERGISVSADPHTSGRVLRLDPSETAGARVHLVHR